MCYDLGMARNVWTRYKVTDPQGLAQVVRQIAAGVARISPRPGKRGRVGWTPETARRLQLSRALVGQLRSGRRGTSSKDDGGDVLPVVRRVLWLAPATFHALGRGCRRYAGKTPGDAAACAVDEELWRCVRPPAAAGAGKRRYDSGCSLLRAFLSSERPDVKKAPELLERLRRVREPASTGTYVSLTESALRVSDRDVLALEKARRAGCRADSQIPSDRFTPVTRQEAEALRARGASLYIAPPLSAAEIRRLIPASYREFALTWRWVVRLGGGAPPPTREAAKRKRPVKRKR